jgi:hypothetical protein
MLNVDPWKQLVLFFRWLLLPVTLIVDFNITFFNFKRMSSLFHQRFPGT